MVYGFHYLGGGGLTHLHTDFTDGPDSVIADGDVRRREVLRQDGHEIAHLGFDVPEAHLGEVSKESEGALPNIGLLVLGALVQ